MIKKALILVCSVSAVVHAETRPLPPIINNSTYANGASYSGGSSSNKPMLEMLGRVESLQTEVQQLRGQVEQQKHEITNLKKRQSNIYADVNQRLQRLEGGGAIPITQRKKSPENLAVPIAQRRAIIANAKPVKKIKPKPKANEKARFDKAFASVKNSHYHQSIKLFKSFLRDFPAGEYSDNATFWLASVYSVIDDKVQAKTSFEAVFTQFPQSEKAALSMLKLADIYFAENNRTKAKQLYQKISEQYADSTSAHMAEKKLQSME